MAGTGNRISGLMAALVLVAGPVWAASGTVSFTGHVPERAQAALYPATASHVSFADASGLDLASANAGPSKIIRAFSVIGADGRPINAMVLPRQAVIAPGAIARLRVIVPFGGKPAHAYRVCAESRSLTGKALGKSCGRYSARRVSLD